MTENSRAWSKRAFLAGAIALIGLVGYGVFKGVPGTAARSAGEAAPDVTLNTANGDFRLSQKKGRVLVLFFTFPG